MLFNFFLITIVQGSVVDLFPVIITLTSLMVASGVILVCVSFSECISPGEVSLNPDFCCVLTTPVKLEGFQKIVQIDALWVRP